MSNIDSSWMSCRQPHLRPSHVSLMPMFDVPPGITDFAIENKPPHLPARNSPSRLCAITAGTVLCLVGSYSLVSATAGPIVQQGSLLVSGVSSAVGTALLRANTEAERRAQRHYEARDAYMQKRRLSYHGSPPHSTGRKDRLAHEETQTHSANRASEHSAKLQTDLLLRMAALQKADSPGSSVDVGMVEELFPEWVKERRPDLQWNENAVLHDLVLAVSQLAHDMSERTDTTLGEHKSTN